jgi:hypothetical protein
MKPPALPNLKHLPFGGAGAVESEQLLDIIHSFVHLGVCNLSNTQVHHEFIKKYNDWIRSSQLNKLEGLDAFPVSAYSQGTTEAFDKFYMKHRTRRFRVFQGEYMYHVGSWKNGFDWAYMEHDRLESKDAVIMSLPFSDTGEVHPKTQETLDRCAELGIPVLIDCAFFGLCKGIEFNLDQPAITDITFSLSKCLPAAPLRIGMRLTRKDDDDSLLIYNKTNYVNRIGAAVGLRILDYITPDSNWERWHETQEYFCQQLGVRPSSTVIFGIDKSGVHQQYNRGQDTSRLCFYRHMASGKLPK